MLTCNDRQDFVAEPMTNPKLGISDAKCEWKNNHFYCERRTEED